VNHGFFVFLHMFKSSLSLLLLMIVCALRAQEVSLPIDFRQHNLTDNNSSIFNPAFSMNNGNSHSIGLWTRWQWQTVDGDPTTLFFNYVGKLNSSSSIGAGFYQHNTGVFLNTGGVLNFAHELVLGAKAKLSFGLNVFGFKQELADNRFQGDPQIQLPQLRTTNDFIFQFAPGVQFIYDRFSVGFASENMLGYNVSTSEKYPQSGNKIYLGMATYSFPVSIINSDDTSIFRPAIYFKSIPGFDTQIGLGALLSTNKFWAQTGYNSFYGISIGAGGRFLKRFSLGTLVEFGTDSSLKGNDPTFELVTSYNFGSTDYKKKKIQIKQDEDKEEEIKQIAKAEVAEELSKAEALAVKRSTKEFEKEQRKRVRDSLAYAKKQEALVVRQQREIQRKIDSSNRAERAKAIAISKRTSRKERMDSIAKLENQKIADAQRRREQTKQDSIKKALEANVLEEAQNLKQQQKLDSIAKAELTIAEAAKEKERLEQIARLAQDDKPRAGEKYEEVVGEDGLAPGYYLIANVFGTKKYFDAFMANLTKKGLQPKSFFRSKNKYNYVYLGRYDTMSEARRARDSKFNGKYPDKTWIYRVVGN
jgi:type IX secretion system PorP/SprF family membrane protein